MSEHPVVVASLENPTMTGPRPDISRLGDIEHKESLAAVKEELQKAMEQANECEDIINSAAEDRKDEKRKPATTLSAQVQKVGKMSQALEGKMLNQRSEIGTR
jgi:hypothetical protein